METKLDQHQIEIQQNKHSWDSKPVLKAVYADFYKRIAAWIRPDIAGRIVELGSGIGNLKSAYPNVIATDLFPNPWLDLVCDGYELPFRNGAISHLVLFDVFHHLQWPRAFFKEARRVIEPGGRIILFEPFISAVGWLAYGVAHHEPVGWGRPIDMAETHVRPGAYYAAQGNATRLFFKREWAAHDLIGWRVVHREAFASFAYLLSGGFSKPALYPGALRPALAGVDRALSAVPRLFGARCLVALEAE